MALLGIAGVGFAATLFTALLAGLSFAVVVAVATAVAVVVRRHRRPAYDEVAPVDVEIMTRRPG
jgi:sugar/nucleoside kinase (ribokinase family)